MDFDQNKFMELIYRIAADNRLTKDEVLEILGQSFISAWKNTYGQEYNIVFEFKNNKIGLYRKLTTVEHVENIFTEITGSDIGSTVMEELSLNALPRATIAAIMDNIKSNINILHKQREYESYRDQVGKLLSCVVKKNHIRSIIVGVAGLYEGIISTDNMVFNERFQPGDKILCLLKEVNFEPNGYQLIFDRKSPEFLEELLYNFIPELETKTIEIVRVVREAGSMAKVMVTSHASVNAVGCCIGFHGQRKKNIEAELKGEKVDFILYMPTIEERIMSCFKHKNTNIDNVIKESEDTIVIVTDDENVGILIGKRGQNARLISKLLDVKINVIGKSEYNNKNNAEKQALAATLVSFGMSENNAENIVNKYVDLSQALNDPYLTPEDFQALEQYLQEQINALHRRFLDQGGSEELLERVMDLPPVIIEQLMYANIMTLEDLNNFENVQSFANYTNIEPQFCALIMGTNIW